MMEEWGLFLKNYKEETNVISIVIKK